MSSGVHLRRSDLVLIAFIASISMGALFWLIPQFASFQKHQAHYRRLYAVVKELQNRRPEKYTRKEWSYIIGWTNNALGNCYSYHDAIKNPKEFYLFCEEAEQRINDQENAEITIEWIWNELATHSRYGADYEKRHRPTTSERLKEAPHIEIGPAIP